MNFKEEFSFSLRPCHVSLPGAGGNLKVRQADKYGWEPRKLLEQLVDIYLHLDSPKFYQAIANDEVCRN